MDYLANAFLWFFLGNCSLVVLLAKLVKIEDGIPLRQSIGETLQNLGMHIAEDRNVYHPEK